MQSLWRRLKAIIPILVTLALTQVAFLNCSPAKFQNNSREDLDPKLGGGGVDGKLYSSYGHCVPQKIDVVSALVIRDDMQKAWMVRESCQELPAPKEVDASQIKIASDDDRTVMFGDQVFTLNSFTDGLTGAPAATVQKPGLLNGYALRPVWKVAGVDFAVGLPSGTLLKDPALISLAGVTVNVALHAVVITGNNVTLDGYDFSLNGGWTVQINGAANTRIVNSLFVETASQGQPPIVTDAAATNLYVGYTTIDGGGTLASPSRGALIMMNGRGLIAEYCWLKNAPSNVFVFGDGSSGGGSATIRYNLIEDAGRKTGGGGKYISIDSGNYDHIQVTFNTSYQTPGGTGTLGWNMDAPSARSVEAGYNTMITTAAGAAAYLLSSGPSAGAAVLHDNFFDLSGAFGFAYPGTSAWARYNDNFDMKTSQPLSDQP